jgi:hypothetical protein
MKSIKNQYIDLQEGKMSQTNFMRSLRMSLPQYVTNVTSFNDAVKILKNKGILTEATKKEEGYYNQDGKEQYSKFSDIDNMNGQEVKTGIAVEYRLDCTKSLKDIIKIVMKNLKKDKFYYTNYKLSGKEGFEPETMGTAKLETYQMKFLEKNKSNLVDKERGMKPVPGFTKEKASSNKAKDETIKPVKNVQSSSFSASSVRGVKKMTSPGEKMKKITMKESMSEEFEKGIKVFYIDPKTKSKEKGIVLSVNDDYITAKLEDGSTVKASKDKFRKIKVVG